MGSSVGKPRLLADTDSIPITRLRLLLTTLRTLADRGYDALSLREVAAEANTATSSIYHFFGSKDAMCRAAIDFAAQEIAQNEKLITGHDEPGIERLRQALLWMGATSSTGLRRDFALAAGELRRATDSPVPDVISDHPQPVRLVMDPVIDAIAEGSIVLPDGYAPDELAHMLLAAIVGIARVPDGSLFEVDGDRITSLFVDTMLRALAPADDPSAADPVPPTPRTPRRRQTAPPART